MYTRQTEEAKATRLLYRELEAAGRVVAELWLKAPH